MFDLLAMMASLLFLGMNTGLERDYPHLPWQTQLDNVDW